MLWWCFGETTYMAKAKFTASMDAIQADFADRRTAEAHNRAITQPAKPTVGRPGAATPVVPPTKSGNIFF
jgi:hypothetical protein